MTSHHTIIIGDSRQMGETSDESVHLIVTSPPYWQLKDYGGKQQIGFHETYESYINNLNLVWKECFRVLHKGCRICINIGDQFARSVTYGRYKVIPIRTEIIRFCETIGMDYMGAILWQKITTTNTTGGASVMGSFPYPRNGILKIDYEFILIFKKPGESPKVSKAVKELSKLTTDEWKTYFAGHWNFPGERQDKHLAMFPEELPRRLIRMFSFVGDTVLDPFLGSGTTSLAAKNLGRNSMGYEINPTYVPIIRRRLGIPQKKRSSDQTYSLIRRANQRADYSAAIHSLPYTYIDPHQLDKKIDPRKRRYGSKLKEGDTGRREKLYTVTEVLGAQLLALTGGITVRLTGVVENPDLRELAIQFLRSRTKGKRIFLRYEEEARDEDGNLLAYVYLKDRTFINAHLIKSGYVLVDLDRDYEQRDKFRKLFEMRSASP